MQTFTTFDEILAAIHRNNPEENRQNARLMALKLAELTALLDRYQTEVEAEVEAEFY